MENLEMEWIGYVISLLFIPFFIVLLYSAKLRNFLLDRALFGYLLLTNIVYFYWRFNYTLDRLSVTAAYSYIFFIFEAIIIFRFCLTSYALSALNKKKYSSVTDENNYFQSIQHLPNVDIFIPTYNESTELLEKTIICAKSIDYPNYQIWILDNGNRQEIKALCVNYEVNYLERTNYINSKPGSLNNALMHTKSITNSEYVLIIDSDYLCKKTIIKRLLLPFYQNQKKIAIVQSPQYFYNSDPLQNGFKTKKYLPDEQRFNHDIIGPAMNKLDIATCYGAPFLAKREPLELVGGFPTNTQTEDINLSYLLFHLDYIVFYIKEELAYAMTAENIGQFISQRKRWNIGYIQQFFTSEGPFSFKHLTLLQRMFFVSLSPWFSYLFRIMFLLSPILSLFFSIEVLHLRNSMWELFLPAYIITNFSFMYIKSLKTYVPIIADGIYFAVAIPLLISIVTAFSKLKKLKVDVTEKERSLKKLTINYSVGIPLLVILSLYIAGIIYVFLTCSATGCLQVHYVGMIWAVINILLTLFAFIFAIDLGNVEDLWLMDSPVLLYKENGEEMKLKVIGLSFDRCRLNADIKSLSIGEKVKVKFTDNLLLSGEIIDLHEAKIEIKLLDGYNERLKLLNFVFVEGRIVITKKSSPWLALKNLLL